MMAWSLVEVLHLPELFLLLDDLVLLPELPFDDVLLEDLDAALLFGAVAISSDSLSTSLNQPCILYLIENTFSSSWSNQSPSL